MKLVCGTYQHADHECSIVITRDFKQGEDGYRTGYKESWNIAGVLFGADQAAVSAAIDALAAAYASDGQDLVLYLNDGTTASSHALTSANTTGGVRITRLAFPVGAGGEYSTYRTYEITAEADVISTTDATQELLSWVETINITGTGGPETVYVPVLEGEWPAQLLYTNTPVRAVQSGQATGRTRYPLPPGPLWPEYLKPRESTGPLGNRTLPKRRGPVGSAVYTEWETSWSYAFEAPVPLNGDPTFGGV